MDSHSQSTAMVNITQARTLSHNSTMTTTGLRSCNIQCGDCFMYLKSLDASMEMYFLLVSCHCPNSHLSTPTFQPAPQKTSAQHSISQIVTSIFFHIHNHSLTPPPRLYSLQPHQPMRHPRYRASHQSNGSSSLPLTLFHIRKRTHGLPLGERGEREA